MSKIKDHYRTLGIPPTASAQEILKARNRLLKKYHPDLNPNCNEAKEITIDVVLAAEVLLDEYARAEYDRVYQNVFGISIKKRPVQSAPPIKTTAGEKFPGIVCDVCGRKNIRPKRNYCMYCGAGIERRLNKMGFPLLKVFNGKRELGWVCDY